MASCSAGGICTSRISTDCTVMPHGLVFSSRMRCSSLAQHLALGHHLVQLVPADRFAQRGLRAQRDGLREVLHFQNRLLRVPHHPEHDGVHVHRHGVARQRGFGRDVGHAHALVHVAAERSTIGMMMEDPRPAQPECTARSAAPRPFPTGPPRGWRTGSRARPALPRSRGARLFVHRRNGRRPLPRKTISRRHSHAAQPLLHSDSVSWRHLLSFRVPF